MAEPRKYTRSVSQLKAVTKCGEAFAISRGFRGERPPRRPWAQTVAGKAFHEMIVEWERSGRTIDPVDTFEQHWERELAEEMEAQPDLDRWMKPPGTKSPQKAIDSVHHRFLTKDIPHYIARCVEAEWEVLRLDNGELALELEFELDLDGVVVKGYIDRIQWWPKLKMVAVEDTKTGNADSVENDPRQLGLYRLAAREVYHLDVTHGRYWFTKLDRGSPWVDLSVFTRERLADDYRKLDRIISEDLMVPNPGSACRLCDVKEFCYVGRLLK